MKKKYLIPINDDKAFFAWANMMLRRKPKVKKKKRKK